jgi:hypothetical protein
VSRNATLPPGSMPDFNTYPVYRYGLSFDAWLTPVAVASSSPALLGDDSVLLSTTTTTLASNRVGGVAPSREPLSNGTVTVVRHNNNGTTYVRMVDTVGVSFVAATDWICSARLASSGPHHVCVILDAGPRMVTWVVDGHVCDGGPMDGTESGSPAGWTLFDQSSIGDLGRSSPAVAHVGAAVAEARVYNRALYTTECIGNWRNGVSVHESESDE